jgi:large conductance mechanosensitive channel
MASTMPNKIHTAASDALSGFKDFIMRGNVIDLSVGIVIGATFTALTASFTGAFIEPLIKVFSGGTTLGGSFRINGVDFRWSVFVNALITFVITAAVLYFFVVTPMNKLAERRRRGIEPEPKAPAEDILLLREIRDELVRQRGGTAPGPTLPHQAGKTTGLTRQ